MCWCFPELTFLNNNIVTAPPVLISYFFFITSQQTFKARLLVVTIPNVFGIITVVL
jgi:hypothetical protein